MRADIRFWQKAHIACIAIEVLSSRLSQLVRELALQAEAFLVLLNDHDRILQLRYQFVCERAPVCTKNTSISVRISLQLVKQVCILHIRWKPTICGFHSCGYHSEPAGNTYACVLCRRSRASLYMTLSLREPGRESHVHYIVKYGATDSSWHAGQGPVLALPKISQSQNKLA